MEPIKRLNEKYLGKYAEFRETDIQADERAGRADAGRGLPAIHERTCHYSEQLIAAAKLDFERYSNGHQEVLQELLGRQKELANEYDLLCQNRRPALIDQREVELNALARKIGPESAPMMTLTKAAGKAEADLVALQTELGRPLHIALMRTYPFLIAIAALAELPVNRMAFELFFQEAPAISAGIALVVGLVIALLAHFAGLWIRRGGQAPAKKAAAYCAGVGLILGIVLPLLYFIAALRQAYVKVIEAEATLDFGSLVQGGHLADATSQIAASNSLGLIGWALFTVNLVIFVVAAIFAFVRHDPHPDYESMVVLARNLRKKLDRARAVYEKNRRRIHQKFNERLEQMDRRTERLKKECEELGLQVEAVHSHRETTARVITRYLIARITAYQKGNRMARTDGSPDSFRTPDAGTMHRLIVEGSHV